LNALEALQRLRGLPPNWDGEDSPSPDAKVMDRVEQVLRASPCEPWVVPMRDGGVQLEWEHNELSVEVEFAPNGQITLVVVSGWNPTEHCFTAEMSLTIPPAIKEDRHVDAT